MAEVRYLVVKRNDGWRVVLGGSQKKGPYPDRLRAIDAAIELADRDGRDGRDSQVLVRGEDKQTRIEWTYGRDPFPEFLLATPLPKPTPTSTRKTSGRKATAERPRRKPVLAGAPVLERIPVG